VGLSVLAFFFFFFFFSKAICTDTRADVE